MNGIPWDFFSYLSKKQFSYLLQQHKESHTSSCGVKIFHLSPSSSLLKRTLGKGRSRKDAKEV